MKEHVELFKTLNQNVLYSFSPSADVVFLFTIFMNAAEDAPHKEALVWCSRAVDTEHVTENVELLQNEIKKRSNSKALNSCY